MKLKEKIIRLILEKTVFIYTESFHEAIRFWGPNEVEPAVRDDINAAISATSFNDFDGVHKEKVHGGYIIYVKDGGLKQYVTSTVELVWQAMN